MIQIKLQVPCVWRKAAQIRIPDPHKSEETAVRVDAKVELHAFACHDSAEMYICVQTQSRQSIHREAATMGLEHKKKRCNGATKI